MKKTNIILIILAFIIFSIVAIFVIGICFGGVPFGINCDIYNGKRPTDKEPSFWCSKDGRSWFEVEEGKPTCLGELTIDGKTELVYYVFENYNRISIIVEDSGELKQWDDRPFFEGEKETFCGVCRFKETEVEIEIFCKDENKEKIIFYKQQK